MQEQQLNGEMLVSNQVMKGTGALFSSSGSTRTGAALDTFTGPQGPQGPAGPPGPQGPQGPVGPRGEKGERGEQGEPGERGPQGLQGVPGKDGTVSFDELTPEQIESLRGPAGKQGEPGEKGEKGEKGDPGAQGEQGLIGPRGEKGEPGEKGEQGPQGEQGPKGEKGEQGEQGPPGVVEGVSIDQIPGLRTELDNKQPKGAYLTEETDPTVPAWAKAETKPKYTAAEVGALPSDGTAVNATQLNGKNADVFVTQPAASGDGSLDDTWEYDYATKGYVDEQVTPLKDHIVRMEVSEPYKHEATRNNFINPVSKWFFPTILSDTTIKTVKLYGVPTTVNSTTTIELWNKDGDTLISSGKTWTHVVPTGGAEGYFEVEINEPIEGEAMLSVKPGNYNVIAIGAGEKTLRTTDLTSGELAYSGLTAFSAGGLLGAIVTETRTSLVASPFGTLEVGSNKDYTTIQQAVNAAADGDTILVYPGVYREQVKCIDKEIHIVGIDKTSCVLIDSSANYYTPPLWMNVGSVSNMTIIEDASEPDPETPDGYLNMAYCIHIDGATSAIGKSVRVSNCILKNANRAALGMGTFQDNTIVIENCDIYSGEHAPGVDDRGAVYLHNNSSAGVTGQHMSFRNNRIECAGGYSLCLLGTFPGSGVFTVEFIGNMCWSSDNGKADASVQLTADPTVSISPTSYGNNVAALNA